MSRYSLDELLAVDQQEPSPLDDLLSVPMNPVEEEKKESPGIMGYAGDMLKGIGEGAVKAVEETVQFGYDIVNWFDDKLGTDAIADVDFDFVPEWLQTETTGGKMVSGISRFLVGFVGAGKALKAAKVTGQIVKLGKGAKYIQPMVQGAVADGVVFDPHEERLSNLLVEFPLLSNPVTEYLAADPNDSRAEGRFKNVLEGIGLGLITDGLFTMVKGIKKARGAKNADEFIEAVVRTADYTEAALRKVPKATPGQADKIRSLGLEPTKAVERADTVHKFRKAGFDIEIDGESLITKMREATTEGRAIDPPPAGRGYERGDMLNTAGIRTEDGKNLVQAMNDLSRTSVDRKLIDPKTWNEAVDSAHEFMREAYGGPGIFNRLKGTATYSDVLDETIIMGKMLIDDGAAKIKQVFELMEQTPAGAALEALERRMETIVRNTSAVSSYMERIKTGVGRGLNMFKNADYRGVDLDQFWDTAVQQLRNASPSQKRGIYGRLATVADDPVKLAKMMRVDPVSKRFWALHNELWINSLLSGPTTQMVNALSSGIKLAVTMPLDKMMGGWGGFKGGFFNINDREMFEEGARAWGAMASQFMDSVKMAKKAFSTGESILKSHGTVEFANSGKAWQAATFGKDPTKGVGWLIEGFGKVLNLPTRFLMTTDEFVSQLAYRSNLQIKLEQTARRMVEEGKLANDPRAIADFIKQNFEIAFIPQKTASGEVIEQGAGVVKEALREAAEANFATPLRSDSLSKKLQNAVHDHPWLQVIMPFIRTPMNIVSDVIQHTPGAAHMFSRDFKEAMAQGGKAAALAQGRLRTGALMWGTGVSLAMMGNITGGGPQNKVQREALLATGWRPYSIKIGDKYVSYSRLDPFGMFLGLSADFAEIASNGAEEKDVWDIAGAMLFALPKNLTSKTYLKGLSDALAAAAEPERNAGWWMRQRALSYVPAFLSQTRRTIDPEMKQLETMIDRLKDRIPGVSKSLPTQYSWLTGKPVLYHGGIASGISPIVWSTGDRGKEIIGTELGKYGQAFSQPPTRYKGVDLTSEQISEFHRLHGTVEIGGRNLEAALLDLFNSPSYDREGKLYPKDDDPITGRRAAMIRDTVERYRRLAFNQLFMHDERLREGVMNARRDQALNRIRSYAQ